jgi:hypothetical protein
MTLRKDPPRSRFRGMLSANGNLFADAYAAEIAASIARDPSRWVDSVESAAATDLAGRMTVGLIQRAATFSNTAKRACRKLGITPTQTAVREFCGPLVEHVNADGVPVLGTCGCRPDGVEPCRLHGGA